LNEGLTRTSAMPTTGMGYLYLYLDVRGVESELPHEGLSPLPFDSFDGPLNLSYRGGEGLHFAWLTASGSYGDLPVALDRVQDLAQEVRVEVKLGNPRRPLGVRPGHVGDDGGSFRVIYYRLVEPASRGKPVDQIE
jgi:hypothetical protein